MDFAIVSLLSRVLLDEKDRYLTSFHGVVEGFLCKNGRFLQFFWKSPTLHAGPFNFANRERPADGRSAVGLWSGAA
jgi:hypothetical protein